MSICVQTSLKLNVTNLSLTCPFLPELTRVRNISNRKFLKIIFFPKRCSADSNFPSVAIREFSTKLISSCVSSDELNVHVRNCPNLFNETLHIIVVKKTRSVGITLLGFQDEQLSIYRAIQYK